jgi:multisubunit Na+/H+ antiporter MnhG subunit
MGTQFLLSLIGGGVAGTGLLFFIGKYAYKWYKKEPIVITGELVAIISILIVTGVVSAYELAQASYHIAKEGIHYIQKNSDNDN